MDKKLYDGSYAVGFFQIDPYFILWDQDEAETIQMKTYDFELALNNWELQAKCLFAICGGKKI